MKRIYSILPLVIFGLIGFSSPSFAGDGSTLRTEFSSGFNASTGSKKKAWKHKRRFKRKGRVARYKSGFRLFDDRGSKRDGTVKGRNRKWRKVRQKQLKNQFII